MIALRVLRNAALLELQQLAVSTFMIFCVLVQPFFIAVTVMFMIRHRPDFDPVYVVVGSALSGLWSVVLFEGNWIVGGERWMGTLELLVGSPTPVILVIAGRLLGAMAFSLISLVANYAVGAWLFGYEIGVVDPVGFVVSLLLTILALWAMGIFLAPLGILSRMVGQFINVLEYPVYALSGFLFPILLLPGWTHPLSYALPPYWAATALHLTGSGAGEARSLPELWAILVLSSVALVLVSRPFFALVLRRAKVDGTLQLA